jgi:long-chain acyl-CoA synthetase
VSPTATLAGLIRQQAATRPDHPYLHFEGASWTYAQLDERSSRIATALAADGVGPGDRVAMLERNTPLCLEVMFAAAKCGAVYVPINWRLAPAEVAAVIDDAQPAVFVVGAELVPSLAGLDGTRLLSTDDFDAWAARHEAVDPGAESAPGDVALQLYTSGTTGAPKGVLLSNENLLGRLEESAVLWGYDADSVNLVVSPLFHIGGTGTMLLGMLVGGSTVMLRAAEPGAILRSIEEFRVTNGLLVPAIIAAVLQAPGCEDVDFSTLRTMMYGASPISETLLRQTIHVMRCGLIQLYGITEHSGCLTYLAPADHEPKRLRSCGRPLPWVELQVVDPDTLQPVPAGEVGEVVVRSTQVMLGYWQRPEDTAAAITPDGWLRTGDAGYLDDDGYLYLHDRIKDMIVSGGENIYPAEIENVIVTHPAVADAAVIGVPHERWGETPHALVVLKAGHIADEALVEQIIATCRQQLGSYKCPQGVEAVDELPRNPAGKVLKRELRERAWAGHHRLVG